MAYCTANQVPVVEGTITLPRIGCWVAELVIDTNVAPSGAQRLAFGADGSIGLTGTIDWSGPSHGRTVARVVGGAGGLGTVLPPKAYGSVALRLPLSELLTAAGETLSPAADAGTLATQLASWARMQMGAGAALAALLRAAPLASWRVQPDGSIWVGPETWPASQISADGFMLVRDDPNHKRQEFFAPVPAVFPGQTLNGQQVSAVEHRIRQRELRTVIYFEG